LAGNQEIIRTFCRTNCKQNFKTVCHPDASKICTIIFPWGKYSYKRLPMGIAGSPDIFQGTMLELMESLEFVRGYIDNFLCISKLSLEDHLEKLE
jgi:hypothetical protein